MGPMEHAHSKLSVAKLATSFGVTLQADALLIIPSLRNYIYVQLISNSITF